MNDEYGDDDDDYEDNKEDENDFAAPVGHFALEFKPRALKDDFTDSNLEE